MNVEAKRVANYLNDISGVNIFENNRRRYTIEARSLFTFVLRNHFDMSFHQIKELSRQSGISYYSLYNTYKNTKMLIRKNIEW